MTQIHSSVNGQAKCGAKPYYRNTALLVSEIREQVTCKRCLGTITKKYDSPAITGDLVGKIFYCSWGYSMTLVDFVKVIKQTEKSLLVQEMETMVSNDDGGGSGKAVPGELKQDEKTFRLFSKKYKRYDKVYFVGQEKTWSMYDGTPQYYNSWD